MKREVIRIKLENLRNEAHVSYNTAFGAMVDKYTPETLNINALYGEYKTAFADEIAALDIVRKSALTDAIDQQDSIRDSIFRGMADAIKSALNHFNAEKREAARKLNVVFDNYGNIAAKTLDQETAAITDLLRELNSPDNAALLTLLGLGDWAQQLDTENTKFEQMMLERYAETSQRPTVKMRDARQKTDKYLRAIFDRLEALALLNGTDGYENFIKELNALTERYKQIAAQEKGLRNSKTETAVK
ncbi:MAG: DUF6261 family protein [Prevotellaceae bacterium]|jgi:hypothetical protein|nr:DUF6261 family protein [Prevotellaceae bacterium]